MCWMAEPTLGIRTVRPGPSGLRHPFSCKGDTKISQRRNGERVEFVTMNLHTGVLADAGRPSSPTRNAAQIRTYDDVSYGKARKSYRSTLSSLLSATWTGTSVDAAQRTNARPKPTYISTALTASPVSCICALK